MDGARAWRSHRGAAAVTRGASDLTADRGSVRAPSSPKNRADQQKERDEDLRVEEGRGRGRQDVTEGGKGSLSVVL